MSILRVGQMAPVFTLPSSEGGPVALRAFRGQRVMLYFYPKDDTPGCTTEACEFRDQRPAFTAQGAVIFGISPDDPASHQRFAKKFQLPFVLLSDVDRRVCRAYGVWVKKSMYGRTYMGVARTTVLIDPRGRIERLYTAVKPAGHAAAGLADVRDVATARAA